jgi:hypothetical protein
LGLAFLVFFGLVQTWRKKDARRSLLAPIGVITFLSIGQIYSVVNRLPIPLTDSERISSRFFILPLVMLIILGSFYLQAFLSDQGARSLPEQILGLALLVLLLHDLFQHSRIWRVENMYSLFVSTPVNIQATVLRLSDPPYITALIVGGAVSLLTFIVLLILALRERRPVQSRQP